MSEKQTLVFETMQKMLGKLSVDTSESKRVLALLRHSVSMEPGENPELFGWLINNIPEELQGKGENISYAEQAIYATLIMYSDGPKYVPNKISIATAAKSAELKREKLMLIEAADTIVNMYHPLRALMSLLKSKGQSIDYRVLACDLYDWQFDRNKVTRKLERDYARKEKTNYENQ